MDVKEAIRKCRSYRRFFQDTPIPREDLMDMVEAARLSPSGRNLQPLKFAVCDDRQLCAKIFPLLGWAAYLENWDGPGEGERTAAYIVQLLDRDIAASATFDEGLTAQSILLQAVELGWGGCIVATVKRGTLKDLLNLPGNLEIRNVIALGRPKETVVVEQIKDGDCRYWRDADGVHHVPKRSLDEILVK